MTYGATIAAVLKILQGFVSPLQQSLPGLLVLAVIFTAAGALCTACNDTPPWWRKPGLATDLCYAVVLPGLMNFCRIGCLTAGVVIFYRVADSAAVVAMMEHSPGPLSHLAFWQQAVIYFAAADLMLYATHRAFHSLSLWRYHAVHHSSEQVDWISAQRFHPFDLFWHSVVGDCLLLLLGIPPAVLIWAVPFTLGMSALVHANLDWTFGPFRYVLASPVFHRWHHTAALEGGSSNFAANFPVCDLMFGTFHMPVGVLPQSFGVTERDVAADFGGQMLHPYRKRPARAAALALVSKSAAQPLPPVRRGPGRPTAPPKPASGLRPVA